MLLSFRVSESCMSKPQTNYDLYCKLSGLLNHQCSEQKWFSVGSFYTDEGTKISLPNVWSSHCSWGCQNHSYEGAALSIKLESLLCPPSKEMVAQHVLTSQWIQTDPAVKKGLRTQIMNENVVPWEQFRSLDKWNGFSVIQGREEHNQPSICSTDTQHINQLIFHCIFLNVI